MNLINFQSVKGWALFFYHKVSLKSQGTKAFIWDFSGKLANQGLSFIFSIFLARLLEPAEFGLIAMVMVIIGIASVFTDIGLGSALIQRKRVLPVHYSSVFYFNISIAMLLGALTYLSAGWIGNFYQNETLVPLAQVMSLLFVINAFSSVQNTKLRKELNYSALTKARFISSLVSGTIGVTLAFNGLGVWSLVAQTLIMGVIYNILIWSASGWVPSFLFSFKALMQLWGFGFHMFLAGLLDAVFTRLDYLIIGKLFTPATLGFFQRSKSLNLMVVKFSSRSLMSVLYPLLAKVKNDIPRFQNIIIKMMGIISFIVFLMLGTLYLISEELITLLYGSKWLQSVSYFKVLVLSGFGYPISALLVNVLSSRGNSKAFLRLEIYKKSLVMINFYVLFQWGIEIYLYGLVMSAILSVLLNAAFASREIDLKISALLNPIVVQAVVSVTAVISTSYFLMIFNLNNIASLVSKSLIFLLLYFLLGWLLRTSSHHAFTSQIKPILKYKW